MNLLKLNLLLFGLVPFAYSAQLRGGSPQQRALQQDAADNGVRLSIAGTVGGGGGSAFTDMNFLHDHQVLTNSSLTVTEVFANGGDLMTCLGMRYSNGATRQHGNGCGGNRRTLSFANGEYVARVELWSTTHRYGTTPRCPYNSNFRSVSQVRVTSSNGDQIIVGSTSGHGTNLCRYSQNVQYSRVDVSSGTRFAILGFQGRDGDLIDQAGVVTLEAPRFYEPTVRELSIPDQDFSTNVHQLLTRNNKVVNIRNEDTNRHLTELQDGSITTTSISSSITAWEFVPVRCPDRDYALYANVHSETCYNIRNPGMDMYLGNNGVYAFAHSGTGEDDILGSYVLEPNRDCVRVGSRVECAVDIVSAFYTDRRLLADHDGSSRFLNLTPAADATRSNWILMFEESFELDPRLASSPIYHEAIRFRSAATHHFLNEEQDGSGNLATQLDREHPEGDFWTLVSRACPSSLPNTEDCYGLLNEHSKGTPTMLSQAALVFQSKENCYFSRESQRPLSCRIRIVKPGEDFAAELCLGSKDNSDDSEEVSFVSCDDDDLGFNLEWDLYFRESFQLS